MRISSQIDLRFSRSIASTRCEGGVKYLLSDWVKGVATCLLLDGDELSALLLVEMMDAVHEEVVENHSHVKRPVKEESAKS